MIPFATPLPALLLPISPLLLSDRLITLAQDAERAGFTGTAEQLVTLACSVFDETPCERFKNDGGVMVGR